MSITKTDLTPSLLQRLEQIKNQSPNAPAITFLPTGDASTQQTRTYIELFENATRAATALKHHCQPGDRIILMLPTGADYFAVVWGALMVGVIIVPIPIAQLEPQIDFTIKVLKDSTPKIIISEQAIYDQLKPTFMQADIEISLLTLEDALGYEPSDRISFPSADASALLQYTSGSTGSPKGVLVNQQNIDVCITMMHEIGDFDQDSILVSWMPLFHNMGFLSFGLLPLSAGARVVLLPTERFMENPARWFLALSYFKGTHSGSPNIGYETCLNFLPDALLETLDLSHWRVAAVGAEPLKAPLIHKFSERFSRCGFKAKSFLTTYGLSEATVFTCATHAHSAVQLMDVDKSAFEEGRVEPVKTETKTLVSVGKAGGHISIVNPDTHDVVDEMTLGEIWVEGPSVAQGYWNNLEATQQTFGQYTSEGKGPFVRTGDFGILNQGYLYVVGRRKELIIVNGKNLHPLDVEQSIASLHPAQIPYAAAAYTWIPDETETLAVFQEIQSSLSSDEYPKIVDLINHQINRQFGLVPSRVLLLVQGALPRTHNGKLQRVGCLKFLSQENQAKNILFDWWSQENRSAISSPNHTVEKTAPETETQKAVFSIWSNCLNTADFGLDSNFIGLGGQSIVATQIVASLRERFGINLSITTMLQRLTIREISEYIDKTLESNADQASGLYSELEPQNLDYPLPLTSAQNRLWIIHRLDPESSAYHMSAHYRIEGHLDIPALTRALNMLVQRHQILQTVYRKNGDTVEQSLLPNPYLKVTTERLASNAHSGAVELAIKTAHRAPFELSQDLPIRAHVITAGEDRFHLLLTIHHIAADGWSVGILNKELALCYKTSLHNRVAELTESNWQYAQWAQQFKFDNRVPNTMTIDYWQRQLREMPALHSLPLDQPRRNLDKPPANCLFTNIDANTVAQLNKVCQENQVTLYVLLQTALAVLMARLGNESDVVIGAAFANRTAMHSDSIIGFFVNSLVIRHSLEKNASLSSLLKNSNKTLLEAYEHNIAFESLVDLMNPQRNSLVNPLFQVMLNLQEKANWELELDGLTVESAEIKSDDAKFDLSVDCTLSKGALTIAWEYNSDLFEKNTIHNWSQYFNTIIGAIINNCRSSWDSIPLLDSGQRHRVLSAFNDTNHSFEPYCIHHLFEERARRTPHKVALIEHDNKLTYEQLNQRANDIARRLLLEDVQVEDRIAVFIERSNRAVIAMLGIMKAGAAYVPIDPEFPAERVQFILQDVNPRIIITSQHSPVIVSNECRVLNLEDIETGWHKNPNLKTIVSNNLAYILYTSGSTGMPKGVMIEHQHLANLVSNPFYVTLSEDDRVVHCASLTFDSSAWEIWATLTHGATLIVIPKLTLLNPSELIETFKRSAANVLMMTFSLFKQYVKNLSLILPQFKYCIAGGEPVETDIIEQALRHLAPENLFISYGPTETTVFVTLHSARLKDRRRLISPIGRPIGNTEIYILDDSGNPAPIGVVGEIYISGLQVARGYWNRPELTEERFIKNPFSNRFPKMYKTGDLGRWLEDGTIDFIGRNDDQIKIRGMRVELGEIEHRLRASESIKDAAVIARKNNSEATHLCAYVVRKNHALTEADLFATLRSELSEILPSYMLPRDWVCLNELPLTTHGKLDRRALPQPKAAITQQEPDLALKGELETLLAAEWQSLLGTTDVGRSDNFFALGGHSLLAVHLSERIQEHGYLLNIRSILEARDLADMARNLVRIDYSPLTLPMSADQTDTSIDLETLSAVAHQIEGGLANVADAYPLSSLQQGILFHHLIAKDQDPYLLETRIAISNQSALDGFLEALNKIVSRHTALRSSVHWEPMDEPVQVVLKEAPVNVIYLEAHDTKKATIGFDQTMSELRDQFTLHRAPLLSVVVQPEINGSRFLVGIMAHHIIADHQSLQIAFFEMNKILSEGAVGLPTPTPLHDIIKQQNHVALEIYQTFFQKQLQSFSEPAFIYDVKEEFVGRKSISEASISFTDDLKYSITNCAKKLQVTSAAIFHAMWGRVIQTLSQNDDVVFGSVMSGRMQSNQAIAHTVGLMINTLPFRIRFDMNSVIQVIHSTQQALTELTSVEWAPLAMAKRVTDIPADIPLFNTLVNYRREMSQQSSTLENLRDLGIEIHSLEEFSHYPFTLNIFESDTQLRVNLQHISTVDGQAILDLCESTLRAMLDAVEHNENNAFTALPNLSQNQRSMLLTGFNPVTSSNDSPKLLHKLFEQQATCNPSAIALTYQNERITYQALNERANSIAHFLIEQGITNDDLVGLCLTPQPDLIAAILGILKAGGAYLPLDPSQPKSRLEYIATTSAPKIILSTTELEPLLPKQGNFVDLNSLHSAIQSNPDLAHTKPSHLAYVIYTSGSTGNPKGVMVEHKHVSSLLKSTHEYYNFDQNDVWTLFHSYAFDFSVWEILGALLHGGRLVIVPSESVRAFDEFYQILCDEGVTVLNQTPGALNALLTAQSVSHAKHSLRYVILGGDRVDGHIIQMWQSLNSDYPTQLINMYGITETCVHASLCNLTNINVDYDNTGWLGRALPNTQLYLLDQHLNPVPIGVIGEIYVAGHQVTRGYWAQDKLTQERFIPNPFDPTPGSTMYRSGDLAKWHADGTLEYYGRNDSQVKIRGYRLELGEIEAQIKSLPNIDDAIVVCQTFGNQQQLIAYWIGTDSPEQNLSDLVSQKLPGYMVPARFIKIESIPLTANGKVDKQALPTQEEDQVTQKQAAQTPTETALAEIWASLLGTQAIGRDDRFADLGGDSLLIVRLNHLIDKHWRIRLPLRTLFELTTIAKQAALIDLFSNEETAENDMEETLEEGVLI